MPYVPLTWLADHVTLPTGTTASDLAGDLVRVGLEEERIVPPAVTGPLVVGTVSRIDEEEHGNGKTIRYCRLDVGSQHNDSPGQGAEPSDLPSRGIVCGAFNFSVGDKVVVALPGTTLAGNVHIEARNTYGHTSDGMICSARELGLGLDHTGIIVLDELLGAEQVPPAGSDAITLLGLGGEVLEINVTPDRGYCLAMRGVAREYAHATGATFTDPGLVANLPGPPPAATPDGFGVEIDDEDGCSRFVTRIVRGIDPTAATPPWLVQRLVQAGMRPISLAVDITNYVMLDLGQPLHAYDLAALAEPIVVRRAAAAQRMETLDGITRDVDANDLLITDSPGDQRGSRPLGLAGVMGGEQTEVTAATSDVLIEAAHFEAVSVARTARRHKLPSEAAKRFERGVDTRIQQVAAQRAVDLLVAYGGGRVDERVSDFDVTTPPEPIRLEVGEVERLTGVAKARGEVVALLSEIGCTLTDDGTGLLVTPPTWRRDLIAPADLVEEVARLAGYDEIPSVLPAAPAGRGLSREQGMRRDVARALAERWLVEVLSYPFIGEIHNSLNLPPDDERRHTLHLANPMTDDVPAMRTSLLDTLLDVARRNVARGLHDLAIYELGLVTHPAGISSAPAPAMGRRPSDAELAVLEQAVPHQPRHVAGVLAGQALPTGPWHGEQRGVDWADALETVATITGTLGVAHEVQNAEHAPWHPGRCGAILVAGELVGHAGELHPQVAADLDLPARTVAFELDLDAIMAKASSGPIAVTAVSTYPMAKEDVAFVVGRDVPAGEVIAAVRDGAGDLAEEIRLFDVYTGQQLGKNEKSLAIAMHLRAPDRTLTAEEQAEVRQRIIDLAGIRTGAVLRG